VNEWLAERADRLAAAAGIDRSLLELDTAAIELLLDVARVAAHESGDRRNAPLICYLVGLAGTGGKSLEELAAEAR
jgi:Domain of unknown function (DUF6457)